MVFYTHVFQSTLSARRATSGFAFCAVETINFNPRSPRGERLSWLPMSFSNDTFQSTLSARRATTRGLIKLRKPKFQSTLSARRATWYCCVCLQKNNYFNPRSPRGERHIFAIRFTKCLFISIHALREESDAIE